MLHQLCCFNRVSTIFPQIYNFIRLVWVSLRKINVALRKKIAKLNKNNGESNKNNCALHEKSSVPFLVPYNWYCSTT